MRSASVQGPRPALRPAARQSQSSSRIPTARIARIARLSHCCDVATKSTPESSGLDCCSTEEERSPGRSYGNMPPWQLPERLAPARGSGERSWAQGRMICHPTMKRRAQARALAAGALFPVARGSRQAADCYPLPQPLPRLDCFKELGKPARAYAEFRDLNPKQPSASHLAPTRRGHALSAMPSAQNTTTHTPSP